eukprot:scaffold5472_cov146-Skeletonema_menzelii.AAC.19
MPTKRPHRKMMLTFSSVGVGRLCVTMISSSTRRLLLSTSTRSGGASRQRGVVSCTSKRCFVSLTQQSQPQSSWTSTHREHHHHPQSFLQCSSLTTQQRWMSSSELPYHIVVGMPALSPTMTSGSISKWNVSVGDTFIAGDSLAVIETDKATIDFEAQDDGVVAKILVEEGGGEVDCGLPIMVTVEEEDDVAAFANFVPDASGGGAAAAAPAPAAAESTPPAPAAAAAPAATPAADLPYHIVVGMPALSPTMEAGTISKWNVAEGESFSAGDSLAVIETDKATIDFEAQDDVVEEVKAPEPAVAAAPTPVAAAAPAAPTPVAAAKPAAATAAPTPVQGAVSLGGSSWGQLAAESSPLARALASKQKEYIEKYGSTGHVPLV